MTTTDNATTRFYPCPTCTGETLDEGRSCGGCQDEGLGITPEPGALVLDVGADPRVGVGHVVDLSRLDSCWECTEEGERVRGKLLLNGRGALVALLHECGHWHVLTGEGCALQPLA